MSDKLREKIYFPEDLENSGLCMRVRKLESDYAELEKKLEIAVEYIKDKSKHSTSSLATISARKTLRKLKGDQNEV